MQEIKPPDAQGAAKQHGNPKVPPACSASPKKGVKICHGKYSRRHTEKHRRDMTSRPAHRRTTQGGSSSLPKLGDRVIDQASRRVLQGEQVPKEEKIFPPIFEVIRI